MKTLRELIFLLAVPVFAQVAIDSHDDWLVQNSVKRPRFDLGLIDDSTFLMYAVKRGDISSVKDLIRNGANIDEQDGKGITVLMAAVSSGLNEIAECLVNEGANLNVRNYSGNTALILASASGSIRMVRFLLDKGADVFAVNIEGKTALMLASENGHTHVSQLLDDKRKPAYINQENITHGREQVCKMLRDRPTMAKRIDEWNFVRRWAERKFAGEGIGKRVDWDPTLPINGFESDSQIPAGKSHGVIRVRSTFTYGQKMGKKMDFEELWDRAIFALIQLTNLEKNKTICGNRRLVELTKEEWIKEVARLQHESLLQTRDLYLGEWIPLANKNGINVPLPNHYVRLPMIYEVWLALYSDRSGYPWNVWGATYDQIQGQCAAPN